MSNGDLQPCCGNLSRGRNWWPCYAVSCRRRGCPEECLPEEDAVRGFEALTAFARDDAEAAREIIRTFVAENEAHAETLRRAALAGDAVALRAIAHKMVPIYTLLGEEELAAALRRLERSEGSADGALRSAALGVAERVGEIVRAEKEYLCDR